jgi:hypothetical protein
MRIEIVRYHHHLQSEWDGLVASSLNGTFLHTRPFFDHNVLNEPQDCSFLFYKKNKVVAVIPCLLYTRDGKLILHSYLRATYGGFVVNAQVGVADALEMVQLLIEEARKLEVAELIVRNPFRIFQTAICDETDYAMWYHGFQIKGREAEIAIELKEKEEVEKGYDDATMRSVKKGRKHLILEESEDFENYWGMLTANLKSKHNVAPTHNYQQFCSLLNKVGHDKIKLFTAKYNGQLAAGILTFAVNEVGLHAQYIASDLTYQEYRPLNVVIDYLIGWGYKNRFKYLNLGTANENNGKTVNEGLLRFKEGFGGRASLRETMSLEL